MYAAVKVKEKMSTNSPCAACKFLRRKCTQECVFAPYFPPDQPQKFAKVHKVYGASNVAKLLSDLGATQREDAVNSLAYEADARLRDPVYGCVGLISILQHRLKQVQNDLETAKRELASYIGPSAMLPILNQGLVLPYNNTQPEPVLGLAAQHQQQMLKEQQQQLIGSNGDSEQPEVLRNYDHQHQRLADLLGFSGGLDAVSASVQATANEFSHMTTATTNAPCLSLGGSYDNVYQIQHHHHHHIQPHHMFFQQQALAPQSAE